jgi:hypothetical protein
MRHPKGIVRTTSNGIRVKSGYELKIMEANPDLIYEPTTFQYILNYVPDYLLVTRSGKRIYIESKGRLTQTDRTKMRSVKINNPSIDIRFMFENAFKKLTSSPRSMTYAQWCDKHGYKFTEGVKIPQQWKDE